MDKNSIRIDESKCIGCNKCIRCCPVDFANIGYKDENGKLKVKVDPDKCIKCGKCLEVCTHDARYYEDDADRFCNDIKNGKEISIIVAPSIMHNFNNYKKLLGFFKSKGVQLIYDVSLGADICIWGHVKLIKENNINSIISQPCPAIVNYIEKYKPELIENLSPIQSPALCTAIYLKKYKKISHKIAFISPCVAKSDEFSDPNTKGLISYNVTFNRLKNYFENESINLEEFEEYNYDDVDSGLGAIFPQPGGLSENIKYHIPDAFITRAEGQENVYPYIDGYAERKDKKLRLPFIADVLNCSYGCNHGTATRKEKNIDDINFEINKLKEKKIKEQAKVINGKEVYLLFEYFDKELKVLDFLRKYTDKSKTLQIKEPSKKEKKKIFESLHKLNEEECNINCDSCGFGTCGNFATAIHNKMAVQDSCIYYNKNELYLEKEISHKYKEVKTLLDDVNLITKHNDLDIGEILKNIETFVSEIDEQNEALKQEIIKRKKIEKELEFLAHYDALTGLVNRGTFYLFVDKALKEAERQDINIAILYLDLNGFKNINDTYGHDAGDFIIRKTAEKIKKTVRKEDVASRLGGDEFAILIKGIKNPKALFKIAKKLLTAISKAVDFEGEKIYSSPSIGIATSVSNLGENTSDAIIQHADTAMYIAKRRDKNGCYQIYDYEMHNKIQEFKQNENQLQKSFNDERLELYFQPIYCLKKKTIESVELLLRWKDSDRGYISPDVFIPVAEKTGLIYDLNMWSLNKALQSWTNTNKLCLSINISSYQFRNKSFEKDILDILKKHNFPPDRLILEITESRIIDNIDTCRTTLLELRKKGIRIALDDFGTGFSSINHLKQLPIDILKIDKTIVQKAVNNSDIAEISKAIIALSHAMNMKVVAEGIETKKHIDFFQRNGCDLYQGFLLGEPMPIKKFTEKFILEKCTVV